MAHTIEDAKSNRSTCRTCHKLIDKGVTRFGFEGQQFDEGKPSYMWHHLTCAAAKMPNPVRETLATFTGTIANRAEIDAILAAPPGKAASGAPKSFPFAEKASTGRAKCMGCENTIEKGTFRIGVERDIEVMGVMRKGPGYYHPGCASELGEGLADKLKANSSELTPAEIDEVSGMLAG